MDAFAYLDYRTSLAASTEPRSFERGWSVRDSVVGLIDPGFNGAALFRARMATLFGPSRARIV